MEIQCFMNNAFVTYDDPFEKNVLNNVKSKILLRSVI